MVGADLHTTGQVISNQQTRKVSAAAAAAACSGPQRSTSTLSTVARTEITLGAVETPESQSQVSLTPAFSLELAAVAGNVVHLILIVSMPSLYQFMLLMTKDVVCNLLGLSDILGYN
jgi:hypothetical protein